MSMRLAKAGLVRGQATVANNIFLLALCLVLCLSWLIVFQPTLSYSWNLDDLHLIRPFTRAELVQTLQGNWDIDGMETPGFRPFTVLFNHMRATLFGESPGLHRLGSLLLMGMLAGLSGWIALKLGLQRNVVALAALLFMATKSVALNIIWITDGTLIFRWVLAAVSAVVLLDYLDKPAAWKIGVAVIVSWVSLWTREDSVVLIILLPLLTLVYEMQLKGQYSLKELPKIVAQARLLVVGYASLWLVALTTFIYRAFVVPQAPSLSSPLRSLAKVGVEAWWAMLIVGDRVSPNNILGTMQTGNQRLDIITLLWIVLLAGLSLAFVLKAGSAAKRRVLFCLTCMVVAGLPGMVVLRANLLLLPVLLFCFALAISLVELWQRAPASDIYQRFSPLRYLCILVLFVAVVGSLYRATQQALDMHPMSLNQLRRDSFMLFGLPPAATANIPSERVKRLTPKLCALGICQAQDIDVVLPRLYSEAQAMQRFAPDDSERPFVPPAKYLAP